MFTVKPARDVDHAARGPCHPGDNNEAGGLAGPKKTLLFPVRIPAVSEIGNLQQRGKTPSISPRAIVYFDDPGPT